MASRKVIRPKFASVHDGYSRESIEDMLVAWSAFWADEPAAQARLDALRTEPAAEPLLASVWTLRMSRDELALERAKKSLDETVPLGPEVVGLALRDPEFSRSVVRFQPTSASFDAWRSTLIAGRAPRPRLAHGLAQLWQREESTWSTAGWSYHRALDEPKCRALEALLDSPVDEVRGAVAIALSDMWPRDASWLGELFCARLEDPVVGTVACRWLHYGRRFPEDRALARLRATFSDRLLHRVDFLVAFTSLGDLGPAKTHFSSLTPTEQRALIAPFYGSAAGKRFLEDVVRDERRARSVRRDAYLLLNQPELAEFAWLMD